MTQPVDILFLHVGSPFLKILHMPPGLVAVMDLVSRISNVTVSLRAIQWEQLNHDAVAELVRCTQSRVLALPVFSDGHERVERLIRDLRKHGSVKAVVLGGPHVEAVGGEFLKDTDGVFCCCESSAAQVCKVFAQAIQSVTGFQPALPNGMADGSRLGSGPIRYEILTQLAPQTETTLRPVIVSSLGCDHKCLFCAEGCRKDGVVFRDHDTIQEELNWIASRTQFPYVMIADDNALASEDHAWQLLRVISTAIELRPDLQFFILARPDDVVAKPSVVRSLAAHGVVRVQLGIESGCEKMRKRYGKRFSSEIVREAVQSLYRCGIPFVVGTFILGGPYEDQSSLATTAALIHELLQAAPGVFEPAFAFLRPYPGTRIAASFKNGLRPIPGIRLGNTTEDRPLMETPALDEQHLFDGRRALVSSIHDRMVALADCLEPEFWLKKHCHEERCRFDTSWTSCFAEAPNCSGFLRLSSGRLGVDIRPLGCEEAMDHRPICTVEIPSSACVDGMALPFRRSKLMNVSPQTARFLSLCNGERTLREVVSDCNLMNPSQPKADAVVLWESLMELTDGFLLVWRLP